MRESGPSNPLTGEVFPPPLPGEPLRFAAADGTALSGRFWPGTLPRGLLVIAHGVGEHGGCYDHLARFLTEPPGLVDVLAFDFRGHGQSAGRRGIVRQYDDLRLDLRAVIAQARRLRPGVPLFVLGHSNGGQVALGTLIEGDSGGPTWAGLILSNPALRLAVPVPRVKRAIGRWLDRLAPGLSLHATVPSTMLSRDPGFDARRRADPLRHSRIGPRLFFGMVQGGPRVIAAADRVRCPTLLVLGDADPVIDPAGGRALFERLGSPDRTLHVVPGGPHEPLNDLGRNLTMQLMADWLDARLDAGEGPVAS